MTALGNVLALIRHLDDAAGTPLDGTGSGSMPFRDFPAPNEIASSLGEIVAFRSRVETAGDACGPDEARAVPRQQENCSNVDAFRHIGAAFPRTLAEVRA